MPILSSSVVEHGITGPVVVGSIPAHSCQLSFCFFLQETSSRSSMEEQSPTKGQISVRFRARTFFTRSVVVRSGRSRHRQACVLVRLGAARHAKSMLHLSSQRAHQIEDRLVSEFLPNPSVDLRKKSKIRKEEKK